MLLFDDLNIIKTIKVKEKASVRRKGKVKVRTGVLSSESEGILYYLSELSLVRSLHVDSLSELSKKKSSD
jgi:hypothetical protein